MVIGNVVVFNRHFYILGQGIRKSSGRERGCHNVNASIVVIVVVVLGSNF